MPEPDPSSSLKPVDSLPVRTISRRQRLSIGKRVLFSVVLFSLSIAMIELACFGIWLLFPPVPITDVDDAMRFISRSGRDKQSNREALHPYLGWVFDPDIAGPASSSGTEIAANELGFIDSGRSVRKRSPDQFIIGILGGSVAQQVSIDGEATLRRRLSACPQLQGKEIQFVRLAMAGYKQPQQLMAFNYVTVLGGEFDMMVNIDGYNELALTIGENDPGHVFLAYPRAWDARLQDVVDPRSTSLSFRLIQTRARRQQWAQLVERLPFHHSWTIRLIWAERDMMFSRQLIDYGMELRRFREHLGYGFVREGPRQMYSNEDGLYAHAVMLWKNSSLQLHHACAGKGIPYLHLLQPNQYHEGSKQLNEEERRFFFAPQEDYAKAIKRGYPSLIATGESLRSAGVSFHDLTRLFADISETTYCDYYCHYNERGNELFAEAIAEKIADELSRGDDDGHNRQ